MVSKLVSNGETGKAEAGELLWKRISFDSELMQLLISFIRESKFQLYSGVFGFRKPELLTLLILLSRLGREA